MNERIKMQGRKVEKRRKLKDLELKADNLVSSLRERIDPFEHWLELHTEQAQVAMLELHKVVLEGKRIQIDIRKLEKALGEDE